MEREKPYSLRWYLRHEPIVSWSAALIVVLLLCQGVLALLYFWKLPPEIPLFYSLPLGSARLASRAWLFFLPLFSLLSSLSNLLLLKLSPGYFRIYHQVVSWFSLMVVVMITIVISLIIYLAL